MIILIVSCQNDIETHGLDAFSLQLLKQTGLTPTGTTPPFNIRSLECYVFFSAHDQYMFWQTAALLLAVQFVRGS